MIIEYAQDLDNEKNETLVYLMRKKEIILKNEKIFEEIAKEIENNKFIRGYTTNATRLFVSFLEWVKGKKDWEIKSFIVHSKVYHFTITGKRGVLKIINIINLLGEDVLTEKGEKDNERYAKKVYYDKKNEKECEELLKKNIKILKKKIETLEKNLDLLLKNWKYKSSIPSIALAIFMENCNTYNIKLKKTYQENNKLRNGHFGGRCEVFGNPYEKREKILHYDFSNMYGNIMREKMPTGELEEILDVKEEDLKKPGFYEIEVNSRFKIPALPHKSEHFKEEGSWGDFGNKDEMVFSNGTFEGMYYSKEIELLEIEKEKIKKKKYGLKFKGEEKPIFKEFAELVIRMREGSKEKIWKKLLTSFYGRLGMRLLDKKTIIIKKNEYEDFIEKNEDEIFKEKWIKGYAMIEVKTKDEKSESRIEYAIIITALARRKLYIAMLEVLKHKGRLLYVDTDSIFACWPKETNLKEEKFKIINWGEIEENIEDAVFASVRCYSLKFKNGTSETKIAGIPRNSLEFEKFKKIFYSINNQGFAIESYQETLNNVDKWKTWKEEKIITLTGYCKRTFSKDKKETQAVIKINEEYL